jgi:PAS domain S-box-containing protein
MPLRAGDGQVLGSFCAIDHRPRHWTERELQVLSDLAAAATTEVHLRTVARALREREAELRLVHEVSEAVADMATPDQAYLLVVERLCAAVGWPYAEVWLPGPTGALQPGPAWRAPAGPGDVPRVQRAGLLGGRGLHAAAHVPVMAGDECVAVLKFYNHTGVAAGLDQSALLSTVAAQLGEAVRRKAAEYQERESTRRFRATLENINTPAVTLDRAGAVTFANDCLLRLTGYTRAEVVGQRWFDRFEAADPETQGAFEEALRRGDPPAHAERPLRARDGSLRLIDWDVTLLRSPGGELEGVAGIGRDVTEQRRAERLKDDLIALVSHELRTPLTAIRGAVRLLESRLPDLGPGESRLLEMASRNVARLITLVNDLLEIERIESGAAELSLATVPAADLVADAMDSLGALADEAGLRVAASAGDGVTVRADRDRVVQVLVNLLGNAVKFSPAGGTISVDAVPAEGGMVLFGVRDEGRGIPAEKLESIFERFEQVEPGDAREKGGAGLGLAISRAIVQQHGGRIWAESAPGQGSTFRFLLPAGDVDGGTEPAGRAEG